MIAVECYADEKLMLVLGVSKRKIRHESGKGRVLAKLKKEPSGTGLVDEDPDSAQPGEMCSYRKEQEREGIYLFKHQSTPNKRLIMLCPRLEEWLYQRAKAVGVKPEDFGLEMDARALHGIRRYDKRDGYERFLQKLRGRDKAMKRLEKWVREI